MVIGGRPGISMIWTSGGGGGGGGASGGGASTGPVSWTGGRYTGAGAIPLLVLIVMIAPGNVLPLGLVPTMAPARR